MNAAKAYETIRQFEALYARPQASRIDELIAADDTLAALLQTLRTNPTQENTDRVLNQALGIHRMASQLSNAQIRETNE